MKIREVLRALELVAPLPLQESYDNAGLQIGLQDAEVSGALLCLDVTEQVVDEAVRKGCNLIVSHHPLIFRKLAHLTDDTYVERTVRKAVKNDIAIISMHTNLDAATGGVNFKMAEKLGLGDLRFFGEKQEVDGVAGGNGVIGTLPEPVMAKTFLEELKSKFQVECIQTNELLDRKIKTVALCGGAGSFLISDAIKEQADAFLTGEVGYHEFFGHEQQLQIVALGHYQSEQYTTEVLRDILQPKGVKCEITEINTNPINYI